MDMLFGQNDSMKSVLFTSFGFINLCSYSKSLHTNPYTNDVWISVNDSTNCLFM